MSPYKHIFFDLDRTLWDMDENSSQTLIELAAKYKLVEKGVPSVDDFVSRYKVINDQLWADYSKDLIDKQTLRSERFRRAFALYGIEDTGLAEAFGRDYVTHGPLKNKLMPHCTDILGYLSEKYQLHIITNGFDEVQHIKIEAGNLKKYFRNVITSDAAMFKKPDVRIFQFSMGLAAADASSSIMIGDSLEADIIGARNSGMAQVYFNPEKKMHAEKVTYEISSLHELRGIL